MALAGGRCLVCGAPITDPRDAISEAPTQPLDGPLGLAPQFEAGAPAVEAGWAPVAQEKARRDGPRGLLSARTLGAILLLAVLLFLLLALLTQHFGVQFILAPSASSSSNSSSNSNASTQSLSSVAATATAARGAGPTPTAHSSGPSPTPGPSSTPASSPTATVVPATLSVQPTSIPLSTCVGAQTQFTVSNTGGAPLSWSATASVTSYSLSPTSGTLNGGSQQVVTVSGILLSGTITVTAPGARQSPQQVSVTCQV
jgi:hypothetical protein